MTKQRIFFGIPVSGSLVEKIGRFSENMLTVPGLRTIKPNNLHITLVPPFYTNEPEAVFGKVDLNKKISPFDIVFDQLSIGSDKYPRLVWLRGEAPKDLLALTDLLQTQLGRQKEKTEYMLHLTLARFKKGEEPRIDHLPLKVNWKMKVQKICLYRSHLRKGGAEYEVLRSLLL